MGAAGGARVHRSSDEPPRDGGGRGRWRPRRRQDPAGLGGAGSCRDSRTLHRLLPGHPIGGRDPIRCPGALASCRDRGCRPAGPSQDRRGLVAELSSTGSVVLGSTTRTSSTITRRPWSICLPRPNDARSSPRYASASRSQIRSRSCGRTSSTCRSPAGRRRSRPWPRAATRTARSRSTSSLRPHGGQPTCHSAYAKLGTRRRDELAPILLAWSSGSE